MLANSQLLVEVFYLICQPFKQGQNLKKIYSDLKSHRFSKDFKIFNIKSLISKGLAWIYH